MQKLADIFKIDTIKRPPSFFCVGHGYMQHAAAEYLHHTSLRCHVYLFPNVITVHGSIIFAYSWSIGKAVPGDGNRAEESIGDGNRENATVDVDIVRY